MWKNEVKKLRIQSWINEFTDPQICFSSESQSTIIYIEEQESLVHAGAGAANRSRERDQLAWCMDITNSWIE